jgi:hypothetical protein
VTQVMTIPRAVPVIPPPQTIPQKRVVITALLSIYKMTHLRVPKMSAGLYEVLRTNAMQT